jgi:DNA-binding winged helix-turn-helix (wHTH) protein/Tol biopolymer transport system component
LIKAGEPIAVEPKAFRVLLFLLQNPGRLVTKDEIVSSVWNDSAVSDNSITRSIAQLRRVLGDDTRQPLYILTVPTVGYRFLCEVTAAEDGFPISPRLERDGNGDGRPGDRVALAGDPVGEVQTVPPADQREGSVGSVRSRRILVGGVAAALLAVIAAALIWRVIGTKAGHSSHAATHPLIEQRVTSNPPEDPIEGAAVSPDGKYLAYVDSTGLYLRELSTGETRPWSLPQGFIALPNSWFPDSTHLLVRRIEGPLQMSDAQKSSLYKLSLLGGPPQRILDNAAAGSVSPDGTRIAYLKGPDFGSELWVMNGDGTNARELTWAGVLEKPGSHSSWIKLPAWSPGGQRIAYFEGHGGTDSDPNGRTGSLMTIEANGSGWSEVWNDSRVGDALWWAPDGRIVFAYREDPSTTKQDYGVYSIRVDEGTGKAAGTPQLITQAEGMIAKLNTTADGKRLVLWRTKAPIEVFIARFDARARQFQEPRRLTLDENENYASAWTADSKAVLFISNRNGMWRLFKQGIDETTPENVGEAPIIDLPRLSPDGTEVLYLTASRPGATSGPVSVMGKPLAGGPPHRVVQDEGIGNYGCARAPSERCVFSKVDGQDLIFVSFGVKDGASSQELLKINTNFRNWVISPDGSTLAIVLDAHRIRFYSLENGTAHDVTVRDWPLGGADWSADSRTVFITSVTPNGIPVILQVDRAGTARVVLRGSANTGFMAMIQSPDGQYGLLLEWIQAENNVWMVENF